MSRVSRSEILRSLPPDLQPLVEEGLRVARRRKLEVYLVGGPVRDFLLRRPIRDVDLAVAGTAGEGQPAAVLAREIAPEGTKVIEHERFGTVSLDGVLDLAGARRETYARPGALPRVEPGSLEEDLQRRDFSVNAFAVPLTGPEDEDRIDVIEVEGGLRDLEGRQLRVLHRRSFHDDPTRALRAARLAPRLGFALTRGSRSALRDALRDGVFGAVSGDRLRREFEKLFHDAVLGLNPVDALRRLADWHVLTALEPGLGLPHEAVVPLRRLGRAVESPPWRGPRLRPWVAGLAVWLGPLPPALRRRTLRRFAVRGELAVRITGFPRWRDTRLKALESARGRGAVDAALADADEERLTALYAWSPTPVRRKILRWAAEDRSRRSPVTGADLVGVGLSGPAVGRALARIRASYLDGVLANREEAVALAREIGRRRSRARSRRRTRI